MNPQYALFQKSTDQYFAIYQLMESIERLKTSSRLNELATLGKELFTQQQTAALTDKKIETILTEPNASLPQQVLKDREIMLKRVLDLNKTITNRLGKIKHLMSIDLQQIKKGRYAMKGYGQAEDTHGRNVNSTL